MTTSAPASRLLEAAILPTLLRLAVPNVLALVSSVLVGIAETYYVGRLGTIPLAAMAIVFPFAMLTQMMSNGAMGGGVSSAISRALGSGDRERAGTLALHAMAIGAGAGVAYSLLFVLCGPWFFQLLGGKGEVLLEAVRYGQVLFSGAMLVWLCNTLASVVRGTGNMRVPSTVVMVVALLQIMIGGSLGLGLGPMPPWGMTGIALGNIIAMGLGSVVLLAYLQWGQKALPIPWRSVRFAWPMFRDILRVGAFACLSPVQSVLTALIMTGLVARFGPQALAGYGIGQRLEFLLIPIAFGIGVASVPMVGMAIGAGQVARARRVAWTAGYVSALVLAVLGLTVMLVPSLWSAMFSTDPLVLANADLYLRTTGPGFAFFGLGLTLYFASLGSGHVLGPILAGSARLVLVAVVGAWLAQSGGGSAQPLFWLVFAGMVIYGVTTVWAVRRTRWE
ncbi:MATE family efflux transporter [Diaphorobacter sp. HDW4A]|uniref:MATE family efflux transporter n=1 Tax=Diaphorobacter sp. HDW4A TaxID=2714924 RepID=UPI001407606B|nr:MATE family efflux transporter [Diaphorobacter sp. HDW4A]QIL80642.1 MATE family efflux transporter [Diaphorobacter sp. HDW4A]